MFSRCPGQYWESSRSRCANSTWPRTRAGSWRARRMIEYIREMWGKLRSGAVPPENVLHHIYVELTEGLDSVLAPITLNDMTMFFSVPRRRSSFGRCDC